MMKSVLPLLVKAEVMTISLRHRKASRGQGVIEYAGALVVASCLVAAVIAVGPQGISNLFTNILTQVQTFFTSKVNQAA